MLYSLEISISELWLLPLSLQEYMAFLPANSSAVAKWQHHAIIGLITRKLHVKLHVKLIW